MANSVVLKSTINEATLYANGTATFTVVGNNSVSNISFIDGHGVEQNVASATIRKIICSTNAAAATWTLARGSNVYWSCGGNFTFDFAAHGMPLTQDANGTIVVTLAGGAGSILVDVAKVSV
jgi:hypothetical protein